MPIRSLRLGFSLILCTSLFSLPVQAAASLSQQRQLYDTAKAALAKGDSAPYLANASALRGYPLASYLAYDELTLRLKSAGNPEIEQFLQQHGDLPQINWLKLRWLRLLAERGDWSTFARYYDSKLNFTELDCLNGQRLLQSGQKAEGYAVAETLWLSGKSQPNACDPLFGVWSADGQLTEDKRWQRLKLAVEARNPSLANYLAKSMQQQQAQAQLLIEVAQKPALLSQVTRFSANTPAMADTVGLGLRRLARQDPELALSLLDGYAKRLHFSQAERVAIAREIGLTLARRFDPRALELMATYDPDLHDNTVTEWRARLLLRLGRWEEAYQLTRRMPAELSASNRWRYWRARSLQLAQPNNVMPETLYQPLSQERDFYGFLAADKLKAPYRLNNRPMALDSKTVQKVRNTPGIRRALEFHARNQMVDARREWFHATRLFNQQEQVAQARLAYDLKWYFPAIRAISEARYWDDLEVRFPMAHRDSLTREANNQSLVPSWVFAITRQESAFMADARSHAGAMGLMQLMPATAKETARRYKIPLASPQQALNPETNIRLGAAYLNQVIGQFNGNRVLASAAYNAGPGRVRQWLRDSDHLPVDVWIENIPFDETRQYVQNVLTYAVIYGEKLGTPHSLLAPQELELKRP